MSFLSATLSLLAEDPELFLPPEADARIKDDRFCLSIDSDRGAEARRALRTP